MLLREIGKAWHVALSVPKSLVFNLRYFPFAQAIRLPVLVSHRVNLMSLGGTVTLTSRRFGSVKLGFQGSDAFPASGTHGVWRLANRGRVSFGANVNLGPGVRVHCDGVLELGDDVDGNAGASFFCAKRMRIGRGCLLAWNVTVMDHDFHSIMKDGAAINAPAAVEIDDAVWLGANVTVLKGAHIARGAIVGACAVVHGDHPQEGCIIAGNPARLIRRDVSWQVGS